MNEGNEDTFEYTVTLSDVQAVDIHVKVSQVEGDAVLGEDVEAEEIVIPAYSLSGTGTIKVLTDCAIESNETIRRQLEIRIIVSEEIKIKSNWQSTSCHIITKEKRCTNPCNWSKRTSLIYDITSSTSH